MIIANLIHFVYTISPYEEINGDVVDVSLCCERLVSWCWCVRGWVDDVKACRVGVEWMLYVVDCKYRRGLEEGFLLHNRANCEIGYNYFSQK
jgi:hypothetical protein